jgi:hydroxymethylglutaryl-CoA reductase
MNERAAALGKAAGASLEDLAALSGKAGLSPEEADHMIENVVGTFALPLGVAANFLINGRDVLVPMVIEEASVVAGASYMAKLVREGGGFEAGTDEPEMIGQIQLLDLENEALETASAEILNRKPEILGMADEIDPVMTDLGGGARDLEVRTFADSPAGPMIIVHLIYDTRDAMGANAVNSAVERIAPLLEDMTGGRAHLRIISNLADRRLARASCRIPTAALAFGDFSGEQVRDGIVEAWAFAATDPYRAATHNKGIMNGVDAVVIATGNDWRAVEAGAHAFAARDGHYRPLSRWWVDSEGALVGELEMPLAVGTVGGATRVHPAAQASLALMGIEKASDLAQVIVSVGLAQNLAALRALATEGIQRGHMNLHARQVAIASGAQGEQIEIISRRMVESGQVRPDRAQELLAEINAADSG